MRPPSQHDRVEYGNRELHLFRLRNIGNRARNIQPRHFAYIFPVQLNIAAVGLIQGVQAFEKGGFSGAIRTAQAQNLPSVDRKTHVMKDAVAFIRKIQIMDCKAYQRSVLLLVTRYASSGTPTNDVTMPTGTTTGERILQDSTSAASKRHAPKSAEIGIRYR